MAVVTPVCKKGNHLEAINYRPISITANLSKTFERLLADQIHIYMNNTSQFSKFQLGFRSKHSTSDALLYATESWRCSLESGKNLAIASLDLSKAFDSIDHGIIIIKLKSLGFDETSRNLIANYLSSRMQAVKVGNTLSDWMSLKYGVPQGTILGPLLFLLYVSDLPDYIKCSYVQFADDTLIFCANESATTASQELSENCAAVINSSTNINYR
jgi:hypothetical protein